MSLFIPIDVTYAQLVITGQAAWNAANSNGINISGNLTITGQTLQSNINSFSGYAESIYVHRTGSELISGNKTHTGFSTFINHTGAAARFENPVNNFSYIELTCSGTTGYIGVGAGRYLKVNYQTGSFNSIFSVQSNHAVGIATAGDGSAVRIRSYSGTANADDINAYDLFLGYNTGLNYGYIDIVHEGIAYGNMVLSPNGGNVGIATSTPSSTLHVNGSVCLSGIATSISANIGGAVLPAAPVGFVTINITGGNFKIPYYNV